MVLAHKNNKLVGVVELKLHENKSYPEYDHWLGGLFVSPELRDQGIACMLIEEVKKYAKRLGVECLYLQCESYNLFLYEKYGFSVLHNTTHGKIPVVIMVYSVDS